MKAIKLQPRKGRWARGTKWKITSIRIPFEVAQALEKRTIAAKVRSPSDGIIQILSGFVAATPAPRKKIKLVWAQKPDASARKQYAEKPAKAVKKAAKKVARKVKTVAKRAAKAVTDPKRAKKNKADRDRRAKIKAAAERAAPGSADAPAQNPETVNGGHSSTDVTNSEVAGVPEPKADVEGLTA